MRQQDEVVFLKADRADDRLEQLLPGLFVVSAVSRRRMSRRCSSESATCFVLKDRSSRFRSGVPDRARRKIARYFSLVLLPPSGRTAHGTWTKLHRWRRHSSRRRRSDWCGQASPRRRSSPISLLVMEKTPLCLKVLIVYHRCRDFPAGTFSRPARQITQKGRAR